MSMARDLRQDIVYGVRLMARQRTSTFVAVLALALGIGANSAIFSVIDRVLLQPLPYEKPERLVAVRESVPEMTDVLPLTELEYFAIHDRARTLEQSALAGLADVTLLEGDEPETYPGARVSADLFSVLGVQPALGRGFEPRDTEPGASPAVILDYDLWRRRFGADPDLIGRTLRIKTSTLVGAGNDLATQYTVVGVLPADFRSPLEDEEIWIARPLTEASANRWFHGNFLFARLAPGATVEQAHDEVQGILAEVAPDHPIHKRPGRGTTLLPLPELLVRNVRSGLLILFSAVALVLLIACANVANLQLAGALARERELALRAAIGAGQGRLVRQMLTESLVLAVAGAILGLVLAKALLRAIVAFNTGEIPRLDEVAIEPRVLVFTLALAVVTGLLFGLLPAWRASRPDLNDALRTGERAGGGLTHERLRGALVVAEVALALVVLIGAGLLIRNFRDLQQTDYGFRSEGVVTMKVSLPQSRYPEAFQQEAFFRDLVERVRALPGVRGAGVVNTIPLTRLNTATTFDIEGRVREEGEVFTADYRLATPGIFPTLGVPVLEGRGLEPQDVRSPPLVIVVDKTFAETYWPDERAIDQQIVLQGIDHPVRIAGVVGNVQHKALSHEARPTFYLPWLNSPAMTVVAKTELADPMVLADDLRRAVLQQDREQPVTITPLSQLEREAIARPRFNTVMLGLLAGVGLLLALLGIYAVMSYSVRQRHHEIGIRMALGASGRQVVRQVLARGLTLTTVGLAVGVGVALATTKWIESQLFGVSPTDATTYVTATLLLFVISAAAALLPALKATRVHPTVVLRGE